LWWGTSRRHHAASDAFNTWLEAVRCRSKLCLSYNSFVQNVTITSISQHTVGDAHKCIKCSQGAIQSSLTAMFKFSGSSVVKFFVTARQGKVLIVHKEQLQISVMQCAIISQVIVVQQICATTSNQPTRKYNAYKCTTVQRNKCVVINATSALYSVQQVCRN
jgi:hypothetical protein